MQRVNKKVTAVANGSVGLHQRKKNRPHAQSSNAERRRVAHHEAGHCIVSYVLGLHTRLVTIEPGQNLGGRHLGVCLCPGIGGYAFRTNRDKSVLARDLAISYYAGLAAESHFFGLRFSFGENAIHGSWDDHSEAVRLLKEYHLSRNPSAAILRCQRSACRLVRKHSDSIKQLAELLLEHTTVQGEELQSVLEKICGHA